MPGYKKFDLYPHDLAKAKELIEEANPSDRDITVWTDNESPNDEAGGNTTRTCSRKSASTRR